ncbi:MAG: hypothetical protein ACI9W6_002116 [Motiliproteus sp.]|jgi:hypothetical protein
MNTKLSHLNYLLGTSGIALLLLGLVFTLNLLVDPLWFFAGNRFDNHNYRFNERVSKLNRLLKHRDDYDCLILGSSRVTLLDERQLDVGRCYNLSFSGGSVAEFIAFAKYLQQQGVAPQTLVVGIDDFNFSQQTITPDLPDFVAENQAPDPLVRSYLSLSVLGFSWRALYGSDEARLLPRYYDEQLICRVRENPPVYVTAGEIEKYSSLQEIFRAERAAYYLELRGLFPQARFIAYVPPISLWITLGREQGGSLPGYLRAIYESAQFFDQAWDFSAPSTITADASRTYDGSHYDLEANAQIARVLNGEQSTEGLALTGLSFDAYRSAFYRRLREQRQSVDRTES